MPQTPNFNTIILLSGFSTYSDRKIFFYSSYKDYVNKAINSYDQYNINFNPNDGIDAVVDLSSLAANFSEAEDIHTFSYLLVLDPSTNDIVSRWYIMDAVRQTNGIYRFTLKRDVVAESLASNDFIEKAPIYVEKGILPDTDPMIVNSEGMSFNQIKKGEYLITDRTGWGYICGYIANDANLAEKTLPADNSKPDEYYTAAQLATATGITAADIDSLLGGSPVTFAMTDLSLVFGLTVEPLILINPHKIQLKIPNSLSGNMGAPYDNTVNVWSHAVGSVDRNDNTSPFIAASKMRTAIQNDYSSFRSGLNSILSTLTETFYNRNNFNSLEQYDGKVVYYNGTYYYMTVSRGGTTPHAEVVIPEGGVNYFDNLVSVMNLHTYYPDWELYLNYSVASVSITLEPVEAISLKYKISSSHVVLKDAPYSMFVIPYGDNVRTSDKDYIKKRDAMRVASSIATNLGGTTGKIYDLQLLPYFPEFDRWIRKLPELPIKYGLWLLGKTETIDYDKILDGNNNEVGAILYMKVSNVSFSEYINVRNAVVDEPKIESQCSFWRLCSPNYNGVFEFNVAKNGGQPYFVFIDCTFKPYNPFIRITPKFNFLYGQNYKDGRGLVCGGDFSLPIINDNWTNYELRNKNYGAIFARDIQNLDVGLRQERFKEPFVIGAGIVGGGVAGGVAGGKTGNPYAAIAGAAVGLGAGIVGGALDAKLAEERRAETKDYAIDRFNLSLANVKALPDSLAKNSAFNIVNKIFPFIEYYTCTDEEKEALRNKIKYDGMTVGRIDFLKNFKGGNDDPKYFKGQLIRAEGITEDDHFVKTLYNELAKGVYI